MPIRNRTIGPGLSPGLADIGMAATSADTTTFDLDWTLRVLKRHASRIGMIVAGFLALAILHLIVATPIYTATGELIFDLREPKIISTNPILQSLGADQYVIDSQVEVVRSLSVARRVINKLGLRAKQEPVSDSFWQRLLDWGSASRSVISDDIPQSDYEAFLRPLTVQRKGLSFVILVSYSHPDPAMAAAITNAVMEAYTSEQKRVKVETISAANGWLQSRVDELRQKVIESERRVQQFKTEDSAIDAKVMNSIYATFLTRLKETQSQEALQTSDARIVSAAVPPNTPSSPKKILNIVIALALGSSLGAMVALTRGVLDKVIWDAADVARATDLPVLTELPRRTAEELQQLAALPAPDAPEAEPHDAARDGAGLLKGRLTRLQDLPYGQAIFGLRHKLVDSIPLDSQKLLAVISPRTGEGKTTTAVNLAREAASSGIRTLLVDVDLRIGAASELLAAGQRKRSVVDLVNGTATLKETLIKDPWSPLMLCPAPDVDHAVSRPTDILASRAFVRVARELRKDFDLVVFDTPSFLDYPDARIVMRVLDQAVIVVDFGQTTRDDLEVVAKAASVLPAGQVGLALNTSGNRRGSLHGKSRRRRHAGQSLFKGRSLAKLAEGSPARRTD